MKTQMKVRIRWLQPANSCGVSLVLTEAVDALDGGSLNVVS